MDDQTPWTPTQEAAYRTVHDFRKGRTPSGATALAPLMGTSPSVLSNKVNPSMDSHKLAWEEGVVLMNTTEDYRLLHATARILAHVCIRLPDFKNVSDLELLDAYANLHREIGETSAAINKGLEDRRLTRAEFEAIDKEMYEDIQATLELRSRLEALIDE